MNPETSHLPSDPHRLAQLARDEETAADTLDSLVDVGLPFLWEDVARHPNVRPETLAKMLPTDLSTAAGYRAAQAIVGARGAPAEVLRRIAALIPSGALDGARREHWGYLTLLQNLASHSNCPPLAVIEALHRGRAARKLKLDIAKHTPHRELLQVLSSDPSEAVRVAASSRLGVLDQGSTRSAKP